MRTVQKNHFTKRRVLKVATGRSQINQTQEKGGKTKEEKKSWILLEGKESRGNCNKHCWKLTGSPTPLQLGPQHKAVPRKFSSSPDNVPMLHSIPLRSSTMVLEMVVHGNSQEVWGQRILEIKNLFPGSWFPKALFPKTRIQAFLSLLTCLSLLEQESRLLTSPKSILNR